MKTQYILQLQNRSFLLIDREPTKEELEEIQIISAPHVEHKDHPFSVKPKRVLKTGVFWKQVFIFLVF